MPDKRTLEFYFDYVSNNAYIAWTQIHEIVRAHGLVLQPIPVLFAGLLKAHGQLGPAEIPAKKNWMSRNGLRKSRILGIPLDRPVSHPFNPLLALRASLLDIDAETRLQLISALFEAVWAKRLDVTDPNVVQGILKECGVASGGTMAELESSSIKEKLREYTDTAIAKGVFGVPTMIVEDELFWGYDDFPYLERYLEGNDPLD